MGSRISKLAQGHPWAKQTGIFKGNPERENEKSFCNPYDRQLDRGASKTQTYSKLKHDHICRRCKKLFRAEQWVFYSQRLGVTCTDCYDKRPDKGKELVTPAHQFKTLYRIYSCKKCCVPLEPGMTAWHAPDSVICSNCQKPPKNQGPKKN